MSDWPWCDVCDRPVCEVVRDYDPQSFDTVMTVRCHGETETARLTQEAVRDIGPRSIVFGRAFVCKRLPEATP